MTFTACVIGIGNKGWSGWAVEKMYTQNQTHVGAILSHPEIELIGVADVDEDQLRVFSQWNLFHKAKYDGSGINRELAHIMCYSDYEKMLSDLKPDIVSIATPVETHMRISRNVMGYKSVDIIVLEKPVALNVAEAKKIESRAKKMGVPVMINHSRRWMKNWRDLKKTIRSMGGALEIVGACNGEPLDAGSHMVDLMNFLDPKAHHTYVDLYRENLGKYRPYLIFDLDIYCVDGKLETRRNGIFMTGYRAHKTETYRDLKELVSKSFSLPVYLEVDLLGDATVAMFEEAIQFCKGKRKRPTCTVKDGIKAITPFEVDYL